MLTSQEGVIMENEEKMRSGDFLADIDINIILRSGSTDIRDLEKLRQAFVASITSLVDTKVVTTETEMKINTNSERKLTVISTSLRIA